MSRTPRTFDNRTGQPIGPEEQPAPRAGLGASNPAGSASWSAYDAANTGSAPPSANLPTITVTTAAVPSGGFPWWFWLAVGLAGGYIVATTLGNGLTKHLKRITRAVAA